MLDKYRTVKEGLAAYSRAARDSERAGYPEVAQDYRNRRWRLWDTAGRDVGRDGNRGNAGRW